ncbi:MAG: hypothetical protein H6739_03430 [Alphaproteobacteria bacterium]|nr:hypothetical protein [Alphaproteobacteria bacterium]
MTRLLLILGLALGGCAAREDFVVHDGPDARPKDLGAVGLVGATALSALPGALAEDDPFFEGLFIGNVTHSGGFLFEETEGEGSPVRSKEYTFAAQDTYTETASEWLDGAFAEELDRAGLSWVRLEAPPEAIPLPARRKVRGSSEQDGTDNVNLPRFTLEPAPLPAGHALGEGVEAYVVPLIVVYYSHNGGWFVGQRKGCGGGARLRVFWTVYDAATGRVVSWRDVETRSIHNYINQPNGAQLDDFLIETEGKFEDELHKHLVP